MRQRSPGVRDAAQPTRSGGRARCPLEAQPSFSRTSRVRATLYRCRSAQTHSRAADAMGLIAFLPNASDSESSREKSEKKFDPFLSSGTTLVSKSAERLFYVAALVTGPR